LNLVSIYIINHFLEQSALIQVKQAERIRFSSLCICGSADHWMPSFRCCTTMTEDWPTSDYMPIHIRNAVHVRFLSSNSMQFAEQILPRQPSISRCAASQGSEPNRSAGTTPILSSSAHRREREAGALLSKHTCNRTARRHVTSLQPRKRTVANTRSRVCSRVCLLEERERRR
jgi:hypothetical protein